MKRDGKYRLLRNCYKENTTRKQLKLNFELINLFAKF